jgi:preprotein translocase YajC subunit
MTPLLVLLGTIAGAWYLLIVRPQKDQQTRHGRLVERLQVGDHVLTVGGIYGRVVAIEQATVVLELAPGLTSRIATDGIARIVHGGEAALPAQAMQHEVAAAASTSPQAMEHNMHEQQHPHQQQAQQQPQFAPAAALPQQPFAAQPAAPAPQPVYAAAPQPQPVQYAPQQVAAPAPMPQYAAPAPTFEPRPWGDVQPQGAQVMQQQPMPVLQPATWAQPQGQPQQPAYAVAPQPQFVQPQMAQQYAQQPVAPQPVQQPVQHQVNLPSPPPMPVFAPFAQQQAPAPVQYQPVAPTQQMPVVQHQPQHVVQHVEQAMPQPEPEQRRHSRAPKGMGSSLRLDDPTLRDTIARAREERADLAVEYQKLTAPLVDVTAPQPVVHHAVEPQFVGHDANGVALFATPGVPGVHPIEQFPAPAHPAAMPRPAITAPGTVDPALQSSAFQRRAPYAPERAEATHAPAPSHAHAHA